MRLRVRHAGSVLAACLLLTTAPQASAQYIWNPGSDSKWSTVGNWSTATVPNGPTTAVLFNGTTSPNVEVDGSFTVGRITLEPLGASQTYYSFTTDSGALTFDNGAAAAVIESLPGGGGTINGYFNVPIVIGGTTKTLQVNSAGAAIISLNGTVSGTGSSLTINANGETGAVELNGTNTYGGTGSITTVAGGVLRAADGFGLPADTALVLGGGVFEAFDDATFTRGLGTGGGQVRLTGNRAGFSVLTGTLNVRLGNGTSAVTWGSADFNPATLVLGVSPSGNSAVIWENGLNLGGATRTIAAESVVSSDQSYARISGVISNGGLTKTGSGLLELTAANTYAGRTTISAGILRAADGVGLPSVSPLTISGGVLESLGAATFSRTLGTGSGQVELVSGGFAASGGPLSVQLNGGTGTVNWGSGAFLASGGALTLGSASANALVDIRNDLDLGGAERTVQVVGNDLAPDARARLSGTISNGSLTVIGTGPAVLELTGTNTYAGTTHVQNATLRANPIVGLPVGSPLWLDNGILESLGAATLTRNVGTAAGEVRLSGTSGFAASGGVLAVQLNGGSVAWGQANFTAAGDSLLFGSTTANNLVDFQSAIDLADDARSISVNDNPLVTTDLARISGVISNGSLVKDGPGVLELTAANTYTGTTTVNRGVLRAADGVGLPVASALVLNGGVYEAIGTTTFSRPLGSSGGQVAIGPNGGGFSASGGVLTVQLNNGNGTVVWGSESFGDGPLIFGSASSNGLVDFQNGLDLNGLNRDVLVNGGQARLSGVISNGGLNKYGVGTLELTNANTYDVFTLVQQGRLLVNNTTGSATGTSAIELRSGATLGGGGKIVGAASVYAEFGSRIEPGGSAGRTLSIQTSSDGVMTFNGTWVVHISATGAGGVAINSGGSTTGTVTGGTPDPINHTFLDLSTNGTAGGVLFTSSSTWEIDGRGLTFTPGQRYSYVIGRAATASELDFGGETSVTDPSRFTTIGFQANDFSITTNGNQIILNFTPVPVPEPATVLALAAAGLGVLGMRRRRIS